MAISNVEFNEGIASRAAAEGRYPTDIIRYEAALAAQQAEAEVAAAVTKTQKAARSK